MNIYRIYWSIKSFPKTSVRYIRGKYQRSRDNFSESDYWSFCYYNAVAQIKALKWLRNEGVTQYPYVLLEELGPDKSEFEYIKTWHEILDTMIDGWQAVVDEEETEEWNDDLQASYILRFNKGMEVYTKYYRHLWD